MAAEPKVSTKVETHWLACVFKGTRERWLEDVSLHRSKVRKWRVSSVRSCAFKFESRSDARQSVTRSERTRGLFKMGYSWKVVEVTITTILSITTEEKMVATNADIVSVLATLDGKTD